MPTSVLGGGVPLDRHSEHGDAHRGAQGVDREERDVEHGPRGGQRGHQRGEQGEREADGERLLHSQVVVQPRDQQAPEGYCGAPPDIMEREEGEDNSETLFINLHSSVMTEVYATL